MYFKNLCLYYINLRDLRPSFIQSYIMSGMRRIAGIDSSRARGVYDVCSWHSGVFAGSRGKIPSSCGISRGNVRISCASAPRRLLRARCEIQHPAPAAAGTPIFAESMCKSWVLDCLFSIERCCRRITILFDMVRE